MVLHLGDENLPAVQPGLLSGDSIERIGCPLDEDDDLARIVDFQKLGDTFARLLVCLGRHTRFVSGASVDARINLGEPGHGIADALQRRRARGVVEVDPGDRAAAQDRGPAGPPRRSVHASGRSVKGTLAA